MLTKDIWTTKDYSRVPFALYHDQDVYTQEQERIFRGPVWLYVGLEAEIPKPGDFRTTWLGDTPVLFNRDMQGKVHAFVNRCVHRGANVRRESHGNATDHTCFYHRWCYDLEGKLIGVPFQRGVPGKGGGMSPDFKTKDHALRKIRVEMLNGIIFGTFAEEVEPLRDYLGATMLWHLERLTAKPIRIMGYQRQRIHGNWKLYAENVRDQYHGSLLHQFHRKFGISRVTHTGGASLDPRHRHNISWGKEGSDSTEQFSATYQQGKVEVKDFGLSDGQVLEYLPEFEDGISLAICSVFPNVTFQQIRNSLAARQIRTRGINDFELHWTLFGYDDDTAEMQNFRELQTNMVGPGGFISMEDGEAVEVAHRATRPDADCSAIVEMGGGGAIPEEVEHKISDIPVRGFWSYYAELMDIEPEGAIR